MRRIAFVLAAPVGAFALTIVIATIALVIFGSDPLEAYGDMVSHASKLETQVDILNRATPFYLSATAAAIAATRLRSLLRVAPARACRAAQRQDASANSTHNTPESAPEHSCRRCTAPFFLPLPSHMLSGSAADNN